MSTPPARRVASRRPRALLLVGGWEGHAPEAMGDFAQSSVLRGLDVTRTSDLSVLNAEDLGRFDLLVPIWTFGEITTAQERALLDSVERGLGVIAWHGFASAWLASRATKHLLGGQFMAHPGGDDVEYEVEFDGSHELARGLAPLRLRSEQYYLLVDPGVRVLAHTVIHGGEMPWLRGVRMPAAWVRSWGRGRVGYVALGHRVADVASPSVLTLLQRLAAWAARDGLSAPDASGGGAFAHARDPSPAPVVIRTGTPAR